MYVASALVDAIILLLFVAITALVFCKYRGCQYDAIQIIIPASFIV
jgi:hypothetical protein